MIFKNTTSERGDILIIESDIPTLGLVALSSFVDSTSGENADTYFVKQFQYSLDGVTYSDWMPLTDINIAAIKVQPGDTFFARYNYAEAGTKDGILTFNSVQLLGTSLPPTPGPAYTASNFSQYFVLNNLCSITWSINVLEKLYKKGQLPQAMQRGFSNNNADDEDFLNTWRAVTHFFALFVCLARYYQTFYQDPVILLEYLTERDSLLENHLLLEDLVYLMGNFLDETRQRGTRNVFLPKGISLPAGLKPIDGEYLRLIGYNVLDEFIYNLNKNEHIGWNIGNSSPMYKGLEGRLNVNKYYCDFFEDTLLKKLSIDSSYMPYVSRVNDSLARDEDESISSSLSESISQSGSEDLSESGESEGYGEIVVEIAPPTAGNVAGLGNGDKRIIINPNLDYEITFLVRVDKSDIVADAVDPDPLIFDVPTLSAGSTAELTDGSTGAIIAVAGFDTDSDTTYDLLVDSLNNHVEHGTPFAGTWGANSNNYTASYNSVTKQLIISAPTGSGALDNGNEVAFLATLSHGSYFSSLSFSGGTDEVVGKEPSLTFGVNCWDLNDNILTPLNISTFTPTNRFLYQAALNKSLQYYFVRGILYNQNTYRSYDPLLSYVSGLIVLYDGIYYRAKRNVPVATIPSSNPTYWKTFTNAEIQNMFTTNIGQGNNLLCPKNVCKIDPFILYDNSVDVPSSVNMYIDKVRVQPLSTSYSKGFINATNMLEIWATNNNLALSTDQVDLETRKYLIPANTFMKTNYIPSIL